MHNVQEKDKNCVILEHLDFWKHVLRHSKDSKKIDCHSILLIGKPGSGKRTLYQNISLHHHVQFNKTYDFSGILLQNKKIIRTLFKNIKGSSIYIFDFDKVPIQLHQFLIFQSNKFNNLLVCSVSYHLHKEKNDYMETYSKFFSKTIIIPPLKERKDDLKILISTFIQHPSAYLITKLALDKIIFNIGEWEIRELKLFIEYLKHQCKHMGIWTISETIVDQGLNKPLENLYMFEIYQTLFQSKIYQLSIKMGYRKMIELIESSICFNTLKQNFNLTSPSAKCLELPITSFISRKNKLSPIIQELKNILEPVF